MKKTIITIFLSLVLSAVSPLRSQNAELFFKAAGSPSNPKLQTSWNKYFTYDGIVDFCKRLAKEYPDLVRMETAGKSYQGRDIIALTISDKKSQNPDLKPGFYIDGNIHSNEIQGTEMALYTAWYLCEMFNSNTFISSFFAKNKIFDSIHVPLQNKI